MTGLSKNDWNLLLHEFSSLKMLFVTIVGGCILISVIILAQVCWPHLLGAGRASGQSSLVPSSGADFCLLKSPEDTKLEDFSISVIQTIKDDLNWSGNVMFHKNIGAWTGILPSYLKDEDSVSENATSNRKSVTNFIGEDLQRHEELFVERAHLGIDNWDFPTDAKNIASYQFSSLKMLFVTIAGGCILISVSILAQVCWPHLLRAGRALGQSSLVPSSGADFCLLKSPEDTKTIKDDLNWSGNVMFHKNIGAWTSILPSYLKDEDSVSENATSNRKSATNFIGEDL